MNQRILLFFEHYYKILTILCDTGFPSQRCLLCIGGISIKEQADRLKRYDTNSTIHQDDCLMAYAIIGYHKSASVPFPKLYTVYTKTYRLMAKRK